MCNGIYKYKPIERFQCTENGKFYHSGNKDRESSRVQMMSHYMWWVRKIRHKKNWPWLSDSTGEESTVLKILGKYP